MKTKLPRHVPKIVSRKPVDFPETYPVEGEYGLHVAMHANRLPATLESWSSVRAVRWNHYSDKAPVDQHQTGVYSCRFSFSVLKISPLAMCGKVNGSRIASNSDHGNAPL